MSLPVPHRLFNVAEYHEMLKAGILTEGDRLELLEGEIVELNPISSRHAACVKKLNSLLAERVGRQVLVGVQDPVKLSDNSEPQPDLTVLRPRPDFYAREHPSPEDILLVIEVADTSLSTDRQIKIPLYGKAGIPEAWMVDLKKDAVEVFTHPAPDGYTKSQELSKGNRIRCQSIPDLEVELDEVLP